MAMIDALLAELEQESLTTRRVLERVPQAHLSWKPHPKSMSLGQLALHVATVPGNVAELASMDTIPEPPAFVQAGSGDGRRARAGAHRERGKGQTAPGWLRRRRDGRDVAAHERRTRSDGDAEGGVRPRDHAEPLVSPSRTAAGVPAAARCAGAVGVWPDGGRESVRRHAGRRSSVMRQRVVLARQVGESASGAVAARVTHWLSFRCR